MKNWREYLSDIGIIFRAEMSLTEFTSKASDRLNWQSHGLPSDDLCIENGIILSRIKSTHRFALIIDPAG